MCPKTGTLILGSSQIALRVGFPVTGLKKKAFTGGTLAVNPIITAVCYWTIKFMEEIKAPEKAATVADKITAGMNDIF
ncbi:MAG: hypothetical protein ACFFD2_04440 [Promethearchaeota archaeon]